MGDPAARLPSFAELWVAIEELPTGMTGEVLEPGVLRTMGRPGRRHRRAARALFKALDASDANVGGSGWWLESEAEIRFPGDRLLVPDAAGWRIERVPELPDDNPITILPDWCCEVLSPSTARDDKRLKLPLYASSGVPWCWLVDPELRLLEIYETVGGRPTLAATGTDDDRLVAPPFHHEIALAGFWLGARA
ncbi:MAG: Uma2 family endonuclease [Myxococcales bacterium]|nr:Uma2 family endonuclease [Myxococcales bacterium]